MPAASVTATLTGGALVVKGTDGPDDITVRIRALSMRPAAQPMASVVVLVNGMPRWRAPRVNAIGILGGAGDDTLRIQMLGKPFPNVLVNSGEGRDSVNGVLERAVVVTPTTPVPGSTSPIRPAVPATPSGPPLGNGPSQTPLIPPGSVGWTLENFAGTLFDRTNAARIQRGLAPLQFDAKLTQAAILHAQAMASLDRMEHTLPGSALPTLASRAQHVGYSYRLLGENIATGFPDPYMLLDAWIASPGHAANLFHPEFTAIGIGIAANARGTLYFCQVFGRPA